MTIIAKYTPRTHSRARPEASLLRGGNRRRASGRKGPSGKNFVKNTYHRAGKLPKQHPSENGSGPIMYPNDDSLTAPCVPPPSFCALLLENGSFQGLSAELRCSALGTCPRSFARIHWHATCYL